MTPHWILTRILHVVKVLLVVGFLVSMLSGVQANTVQTAADQTATGLVEVVEAGDQYPIRPSEAANIAKDAHPDAKVLSVKLLPSGVYAVTLKAGGSVSRVMVDATSGVIN
jgi:hypothetical protein